MLQNPVEYTLNRKGQLGVKSLPASIELSVEIESSRKFAKYHCRVPGSGLGASMARSESSRRILIDGMVLVRSRFLL